MMNDGRHATFHSSLIIPHSSFSVRPPSRSGYCPAVRLPLGFVMESLQLLIRTVSISVAFIFVFASPSPAQQLPREQWGAPAVAVSHAGGKWTIAGKKNGGRPRCS